VDNGTHRTIRGKERVFYDGYWIRHYAPPADTLASKKELIDSLTRRTFHHTESGINTPGLKLEQARQRYEEETDPARKRVNGAMLAGALFNRATDIFTSIVALEEKGIHISRQNELMKQCSECFREALELGKQVKHHSGQEGVDELWGEPFRVFALPISNYYESRYIKIALTMKAIDAIAARIVEAFDHIPGFEPVEKLIPEFSRAAREEAEIMKSDPDFFHTWPEFVSLGEQVDAIIANVPARASVEVRALLHHGELLLREGRQLINWLAGVRVPMPKSTNEYLSALSVFETRCAETGLRPSPKRRASGSG
jgi:hypothetical protein